MINFEVVEDGTWPEARGRELDPVWNAIMEAVRQGKTVRVQPREGQSFQILRKSAFAAARVRDISIQTTASRNENTVYIRKKPEAQP